MRIVIFTAFIFCFVGASAQSYDSTKLYRSLDYGWQYKRLKVDSILHLPNGVIINRAYRFPMTDTTSLSYRINSKLSLTDTGAMLAPYMKKVDTISLSNRIDLRVKYSDTAAMLLPYLRKLDTASLSNRIDARVKYTDTAAMLLPYMRDEDTVSLSNRINKKQDSIILTTTGSSGASTLIGSTLNVPDYSFALTGYVPYVGATTNVNLGLKSLNGAVVSVDSSFQIKNREQAWGNSLSDYTAITADRGAFNFFTEWQQGQQLYKNGAQFVYPQISGAVTVTKQYRLPVRNGTIALVEDTVNLSNRIDAKLAYTDTVSLSNRINLKADKSTTLTINGTGYDLSASRSWTIPTTDTTSLSNRINAEVSRATTAEGLKLNISDTASMLANYQTAINNKLNISDTAAMLSPYYKASNPAGYITSASIAGKLNISDTAAMLSGYQSAINLRLKSSDTVSLSNRINLKADDNAVVHIAGTETVTGFKTFSPAVVAASAIARGTYLTPALNAAANADVLVGLDISPTFTNGAYTSVSNYAIRSNNFNVTNTGDLTAQSVNASKSLFYYGVTSGSPTEGLRIIGQTPSILSIPIEIGNLNTNSSTFLTTNPVTVGSRNTYYNIGSVIFGNINTVSSPSNGYIFGNSNVVNTNNGTHIIIGSNNTTNAYTNGQAADIIIGTNNNNNSFRGGGLFGNSIKYYANQQLAFGSNSTNVNFGIKDVFFGFGVQNENTSVNSNNGNGQDVSINPSWAANATDRSGGNLLLNGGIGTGAGTPGDVVLSTASTTTTGTTLQTQTNRWWIKGANGTLTNVVSPNASAAIQIDATTKGFLQPRMTTTQRNAITTPATGLSVYNTTTNTNDYYNGTAWVSASTSTIDTTSLSNRINTKADILSGTTNTVPKFTSSTTIGNSNIKDNGNAVTVNATAGSFGALQVGSYNGSILMNTNNTSAGLIFQNTSASNKLWDFSSYDNDINFSESGISPPVMTLKSGGNIGINTNVPGHKLEVNGTFKSVGIATFGSTLSNGTYTYTLPSATGMLALTSQLTSGTVTSIATGLGLSGGTITTSGTLLVDTSSASILSRQRAAATYATTSALSGYLPLTGGTLTGALGGTSATFISTAGTNNAARYNVSIGDNSAVAAGNGGGILFRGVYTGTTLVDAAGISSFKANGTDGDYGYGLSFVTRANGGDLTSRLTIASTGAATFSGKVNMNLSANVPTNQEIQFGTATGDYIGQYYGSDSKLHFYNGTGGADFLNISRSTGAAIFSSRVNVNGATDDGSTALNVSGSIKASGVIGGSLTSLPQFYINSLGSNYGLIQPVNSTTWGLAYGGAVASLGTNVLTWNTSGNVGIGTTLPLSKLSIKGIGDATGVTLTLENGGQVSLLNDPIGIIDFYSNDPSASSFGVFGKISVNNDFNGAWNGTVGRVDTYMSFATTVDAVLNERMRISSTGYLTIGTLAGTGSRAVIADANGGLTAPVSDSSVKENIQPLVYGIADIMKLKPVSFEYIKSYKNYGQGKQIGNIAQDMQNVIPEAVFTTPSTGKMGINYDQLNGVYIKALQELQEQIKELQSKIQTLENK